MPCWPQAKVVVPRVVLLRWRRGACGAGTSGGIELDAPGAGFNERSWSMRKCWNGRERRGDEGGGRAKFRKFGER